MSTPLIVLIVVGASLGSLVLMILAVLVLSAAPARQDSDTVEYVGPDGQRMMFEKWDAMVISAGRHPTYYFDENHHLKRRPGR